MSPCPAPTMTRTLLTSVVTRLRKPAALIASLSSGRQGAGAAQRRAARGSAVAHPHPRRYEVTE